jgi:hypothetical protein
MSRLTDALATTLTVVLMVIVPFAPMLLVPYVSNVVMVSISIGWIIFMLFVLIYVFGTEEEQGKSYKQQRRGGM